MAQRPVFVPVIAGPRLVKETMIEFVWNPGMAPTQKRKNVDALHAAAKLKNLYPLLEISTKSDSSLGQHLSAFNLKVPFEGHEISLENAFQGSKIFENGGPYTDIFDLPVRDAKRDPRLRASGDLVGFIFAGNTFPIFPKTAFYDWLYIRALHPHKDFLKRLYSYAGFTDIEFNPGKSINCQARSCATFVSLDKKGFLDRSAESFSYFLNILSPDSILQPHSESDRQMTFL